MGVVRGALRKEGGVWSWCPPLNDMKRRLVMANEVTTSSSRTAHADQAPLTLPPITVGRDSWRSLYHYALRIDVAAPLVMNLRSGSPLSSGIERTDRPARKSHRSLSPDKYL